MISRLFLNALIVVFLLGASARISAAETSTGTDGLGLDNPSLAMGLNGLADWSTQHPFVDLMKSARPWTGHLKGRWGGVTAQDLEDQAYLDPQGWLVAVPPEVERVETLFLTDQPKGSRSLAGKYRLTYEGEGSFKLTGRARVYKKDPGERWFSYSPNEGSVGIAISQTDPNQTGNYLRNFKVVREDHIALDEAGFVFNPLWLSKVEDLRLIRFMDWMFTNGSEAESLRDWAQRSDYTFIRRGVPVEIMVDLANQIGADPWFTMPHKSDDVFMRTFATYVRDHLDPDLKAYVEYSNEVWNFGFSQSHWAAQKARDLWGDDVPSDSWMQFVGMRAAEMALIWQDVYGADSPTRLVKVIGTHSNWPGLEEPLFEAPLMRAQNPDSRPPVEAFDALAVTGYFGSDMGQEDGPAQVLDWIEDSREKARQDGIALGLKRVILREYVKDHQFDAAVPLTIEAVRNGSLKHYLTETLPYLSKVAKDRGLDLVMYEGGTHIVGIREWNGNDDLSAFFQHLNYTPEISEIYDSLLAGWKEQGGTFFNAFVDVAPSSQYGSWGALRHLDDETQRYDTLMAFNRDHPAWWEERAKGTFQHGMVIHGTDAGEDLHGTVKRDVILAGPGDDTLFGSGPGDYLHGGDGNDHAVLPGDYSTYEYQLDGARLIALSPGTRMIMFDIETFAFGDTPEIIFATKDFF